MVEKLEIEPKAVPTGGEEQGTTVFVQFLVLGLDPAWRRLAEDERSRQRSEFVEAIQSSKLESHWYSPVGMKAGVELLFWRLSPSLELLQEDVGVMMRTKLGSYLELKHVFNGLVRSSLYSSRPSPQDQGLFAPDRRRYLIVYPFAKTSDWYLLSRDTRQGMMNEHIRVGHQYPAVRQLLAYAFGLDDPEFIVTYETDDMKAFQDLVMALRETEVRRYTLNDTPIFAAIHRPLKEALSLLG